MSVDTSGCQPSPGAVPLARQESHNCNLSFAAAVAICDHTTFRFFFMVQAQY